MTAEDARVTQLETAVRDLVERLGETNTSLGTVATKLDMYMAERERADKRAYRYQEQHDKACDDCQRMLRGEIAQAAKAGPFVEWVNRYKVLVAIAAALFLMFGREVGLYLVELLTRGG